MKRLLTLSTATILSLVAIAQPPPHALVPDLGATPRNPAAEEDACNIKDQLTRDMAFTESEKFASKLLLGTFAVTNKYNEIRRTPAMQNMNVPLTENGEVMKKLLEMHHDYIISSLDNSPSSVSGAYFVGTLPPAVVVVAGLTSLSARNNAALNGPHSLQNRSLRLGAKSVVFAGIASAIANSSTNSVLTAALPQTAAELSLTEQRQIREQLETGIDAPARFLGEVLNWNEAQRAQFSRALNRKVTDTMIKTASGTGPHGRINKDQAFRVLPLDVKIVANLADISFVDLIKQEKLAGEEQLAALQQMQVLQDMIRKIQSQDVTPTAAKKELESGGKSMRERMLAILRLHRLLQQTEKELPDGAAKNEIKKLIAETTTAVETIRTLCALGA